MNDCYGSVLLKKSAIVSVTEKYASEIEILNPRTGVRTQISRSSVLKMRFHRSISRQFEKTDFFNTIDPSLPVGATTNAGHVECKRLVSTEAIDWLVTMQMGSQVHAIASEQQFSRLDS